MNKTGGPSILVVDDEFSIVETLTDILVWEGYTVTSAPNGRLALEAILASKPSLLVVDFMMPVMDGLQLIAAIRADPALADLPIVMMTAAFLPSPAVGEARWDAFLRKPFDVDALLKVIAKFLPPPG